MIKNGMLQTIAAAAPAPLIVGADRHRHPAVSTLESRPTGGSKKALWAGRLTGGAAVLFLLFDSITKVARFGPSVEATVSLGYPASAVVGIGLVELVCLAVYLVRRTSVLGAVLLTGYLGGAIATHVRLDSPLFTHVLFPIYVAALVWLALFLRDVRVRALISRR